MRSGIVTGLQMLLILLSRELVSLWWEWRSENRLRYAPASMEKLTFDELLSSLLCS